MQVFVNGGDLRAIVWRDCYRWIDAGTFQTDSASEAVGFFIHPIQTKRQLPSHWLIEVAGDPPVSKPASQHRECPHGSEPSFLGYSINDAASAASSKDHCIRALERLD